MSIGDDPVARTLEARRTSLREGHAVTVDIPGANGMSTVTAFPDGTIAADSAIHIDRIDIVEPKRRQ